MYNAPFDERIASVKVSFSRDFKGQARGIQKFGALLSGHLQNLGAKIVAKHERSDIHLAFVHGSHKQGAKTILRVDGVYYDRKRLHSNASIKKSVASLDGVVFQSKWAKTFVEGMLKVRSKKSTVIYNGTDQTVFKRQPTEFDHVFLCCANWRVNKRLKSIVRAFEVLLKQTSKNVGLFVVGKPDFVLEHPSIRYFGQVKNIADIYAQSDYMCHICHLDACPNSVVEGLSAGLPVLCNNIGGTPELVGSDGIILPLDQAFNFKPIERMAAVGHKIVNHALLVKGMEEMMDRTWQVSRPDLSIEVSAKQYFDFFNEILGEK